jgi:replicative DNA helicase
MSQMGYIVNLNDIADEQQSHDFESAADILGGNDPERRRLVAGLKRILTADPDMPTSSLAGELIDLGKEIQATLVAGSAATPAAAGLDRLISDIAARYRHKVETGLPLMGHPTGLSGLDKALNGLEPGMIGFLLAGPGTGKTNLSNQIACHVAAAGSPVIYITYENAIDDLILKNVCRLAGVSPSMVRRGGIAPDQLAPALQTFRDRAGRYLYYVSGTATTSVASIRALVDQVRRQHPDAGHPLVVVDYLQSLARSTGVVGRGAGIDDIRGRVGNVSLQLRDLATETGSYVWAISSTNRQAYANEKSTPGLSSAKESGDVEFDADHVLALTLADDAPISHTHDHLQLKIVKQRHGISGLTINLQRDKTTLRVAETQATVKSTTPPGTWTRAAAAR